MSSPIGPRPKSKHQTVLRRLEEPLKVAQLFYRTSTTSRSHPFFQRNDIILPPFVSSVCNDVLHEMGFIDGVHVFHLAEGEADGYCVSLATELGAFVLGNDSDFVILGASTQQTGYRGFIPIEMVQWMLTEEEPASASSAASTIAMSEMGEEDGFTVKRSKRKTSSRGTTSITPNTQTRMLNGLVPPPLTEIAFPDAVRTMTLILPSFCPSALSDRLRIPSTHLRLLASLLGTDHSPPEAPLLFFDSSMKKTERIEHVARVIRECLVPGAASRLKKKRLPKYAAASVFRPRPKNEEGTATDDQDPIQAMNAGDELYSFISLVVQTLLLRPLANDEMLHDLIIAIIEATCHYILPCTPTELGLRLGGKGSSITGYCCSTYPYCACHPVELVVPANDGKDADLIAQELGVARLSYARARKSGYMSTLSAYLHSDRSYLHVCLADPEGQPLRAFEETSNLRIKAWEIMLEAVRYLPCDPKVIQDDASATSEQEDLGEEQAAGAHLVDKTNINVPEEVNTVMGNNEVEAGTFYFTDYLRSGSSTRLTEFNLPLFTTDSRPGAIALRTPLERFTYFLELFGSNNQAVLGLPLEWQSLAAILRVSISLHSSVASQRKIKLLTAQELRRIVTAGFISARLWNNKDMLEKVQEGDRLLLETRNCHIVALVTTAAQEALMVAQALRLHGIEVHERKGENVDRLSYTIAPYHFIEGTIWHRVLSAADLPKLAKEDKQTIDALYLAVTAGMEDKILGISMVDRSLKNNTEPESNPPVRVNNKRPAKEQNLDRGTGKTHFSRYGVLSTM
jgi:hypothetical protein